MNLHTTSTTSGGASHGLAARLERARDALGRFPYAALALPLRFGVGIIFWNSAMTKLADWNAAVSLFTDEYHVPLLPPLVAAYLTVSIELTTPVLLALGLATRLTALLLLGMTCFIELFIYPLAWPTHLQWAAMLLVLFFRGPGAWSLDELWYPRLVRGRLRP